MEQVIQHGSSECGVIKAFELAGLRSVDRVYFARTKVSKHAHQGAVFCVGLSGTCHESFAGKLRHYQARTVQFLPPGQSHSLDFPVTDTRAFSIEADVGWIDELSEFSLQLDSSVHVHGGELSALMMKAYAEFCYADSASPVTLQGLVMEMFAAVSRHRSSSLGRRPQRWLMRVDELLHENFTEHLTLAQVASAAGVHPVHVAREFRRFHGCTIGEYSRRLRVEKACRHLTSKSESLATIAALAGFSDQSHFTRTFKRIMGMTPSQYRAHFDTH